MGVDDPWWENLVNDVFHVLWLLIPLGVAGTLVGSWWAVPVCGVFGLAHGLVIELLKETPDSWDTVRDIAGYALGGVLGGLWVALV